MPIWKHSSLGSRRNSCTAGSGRPRFEQRKVGGGFQLILGWFRQEFGLFRPNSGLGLVPGGLSISSRLGSDRRCWVDFGQLRVRLDPSWGGFNKICAGLGPKRRSRVGPEGSPQTAGWVSPRTAEMATHDSSDEGRWRCPSHARCRSNWRRHLIQSPRASVGNFGPDSGHT